MVQKVITWVKTRKHILHLIFFLASIAFVVLISPREGKFRYEFQKGRPWLNTPLIAPWDFPVLKPESVVAREQDSIISNFTPYFRFDSEAEARELQEFEKYLSELAPAPESDKPSVSARTLNYIRRDLSEILRNIYERGIIEGMDIAGIPDLRKGVITVVKGRIAEQWQVDGVLSQKDAYQLASNRKDQLEKSLLESGEKDASAFVELVAFYNFIKPNLIYDAVTSAAVKERLIREISLSRGLIQRGELIITSGEIVGDEKLLILESLKKEYEKRLGQYDRWFVLFGRLMIVASCYLVLYLFMYNFRFEVLNSTIKTFFIILVILLFFIITRLVTYMPNDAVFLIPFAIIPIVIRTFYDSRLALFIHLVAIMLAGFIVPNSFEFVFMNFIAGVVAIFSLTTLYRRSKLFFTALMVFLAYSVVYFGIGILQEGSIANMNWKNYMWFAGNGMLLMLSYPLIFIFEKTFRFLSDATLFELSDTNQPLLRRLAEEAPGSFQHSLQVANLAGEAARKIGANHLLVRTGALYHDIGKINSAEYFIENQVEGFSPHDMLDPLTSSKYIINHVAKGVEMAKKYKLPSPIIDFIQTHHGTTVAYFFYKKYLDLNPRSSNMEKEFAYSGPKPFSKETAIVMMADAVEASSRTLASYSDENINELVERIIYLQEQDGQFSGTPLTYKDISDIKAVFFKRLTNIYHARIAYPAR